MSNEQGLSLTKVEAFSESFKSNKASVIASRASVKNGLLAASIDYEGVRALPHTFSVNLNQGSITAQKVSGRCWLFAGLNVMRYEIIHRFDLKDFELSQCFPFFYDKLEKANYFLENMMSIVDEPVDGRLYSFLNTSPLQDGGQWSMFANLIKKYGIVPKEAYPDGENATNSRYFDGYITSKLREYAVELRKRLKAGESLADCRKRKEEMMEEVYRMLSVALGEPPKSFDLVLHTKDDKVIEDHNLTPKAFYDKYIGMDLDSMVSLINAPTEDKPMKKTFTVKYLGNVREGDPVRYLNLPMDVIKKAVIAQLKDQHPVWFGSDCGAFSLRDEGVFDRASARVEDLFAIHYDFTKGERLTYGDSAMNHAMVIMGVNLNEKGEPDRWRIENSWGDKAGKKGYYVASDAWFDEYVYQVVVDKAYLAKEIQELLSQEMIPLEPWDPMGTLA